MSKCSLGYSTPLNTGKWDGSGLQGLTTSLTPAAEQELAKLQRQVEFPVAWLDCMWLAVEIQQKPLAQTLWGSSSRTWWKPAWWGSSEQAGVSTKLGAHTCDVATTAGGLYSMTLTTSHLEKQQGHLSLSKSFRALVYASMPGWMKQIQSTLCWLEHSVKSLNFKSCSQTL